MSALIKWFSGARWKLAFSHCFEGLLVHAPVAIVAWLCGAPIAAAWAIGAACVIVFYYSQEKTEYQLSVVWPGQSHITVWTQGWFPWQWDRGSQLDLLFPFASSSVIAALVYYF